MHSALLGTHLITVRRPASVAVAMTEDFRTPGTESSMNADAWDPSRLDNLLFVTSEEAVASDWEADVAFLRQHAPEERVLVLPSPLADCYQAADLVRPVLDGDRSIKGVVILGNYAAVPSRRMLSVDPGLLGELALAKSNEGGDADGWWVWSDDIYGDRNGVGVPDLPISRLPIKPTDRTEPGSAFRSGPLSRESLGFRAAQFPFADAVYCLIDPESRDDPEKAMWQSLPKTQNPPRHNRDPDFQPSLGSGDLASERLYLVLHGLDARALWLGGTVDTERQWNPTAVDDSVVEGEWHSPGVILGGVCWGALVVKPKAQSAEPGTSLEPRSAQDSVALALLDHGANAFMGFTAFHYVPNGTIDLGFGARLHWYVWENIAHGGLQPAEALFQAKTRFIKEPNLADAHILDRAAAMKTFWSATCLGFGW